MAPTYFVGLRGRYPTAFVARTFLTSVGPGADAPHGTEPSLEQS